MSIFFFNKLRSARLISSWWLHHLKPWETTVPEPPRPASSESPRFPMRCYHQPITQVVAPIHRSIAGLSINIHNVTIRALTRCPAPVEVSASLLHEPTHHQPTTHLPHMPTMSPQCWATSTLVSCQISCHVSLSATSALVPHHHSVKVDFIVDYWPLLLTLTTARVYKVFLNYFFILISYFWSIYAFDISRWNKMRFLLMFMQYWMALTILFSPNLCLVFSNAASSHFMWLGISPSQLKLLPKLMTFSTLVSLIGTTNMIRFLSDFVTLPFLLLLHYLTVLMTLRMLGICLLLTTLLLMVLESISLLLIFIV